MKKLIILIAFLSVHTLAFCQGEEETPVDSQSWLLMVGGLLLGAYVLYRQSKKQIN